ncbi:MAG: DUF4363 family protein [Oscillospiraceae bacterium]|nr:DUF4363 family protein [Oscillospiraceae bacterium]
MGKPFWFGIGILALFLALGLGISMGMDAIHEPIGKDLELAAQKALDGQMDEAAEIVRQASARWHRYWKLTASVADHTPMDETDMLFGELLVYAREGDRTHFAACCSQLEQMIESISAAHRLNWWNLL